jgi:hypothetical protein
MQRVRQHIVTRAAEFGVHPFMRTLAATPPLSRVVPFVPLASFFILGFQDLVRMMGERASDPRLRELLRQHCEEEAGHDQWFLSDVVRLAGAQPGIATLFGPQHARMREATYALAAEALGARDDVERLCLLLAMEGIGEVTFGALEPYFTRVGAADGLLFFAGRHVQAEKEHTVFEDEMAKSFAAIALDSEAYARACGVVDRTHAAFNMMLDRLARAMTDGPAA